MNIRIENADGFSVEAGGKSDLKLLDYPDFGCPSADLKSDNIPGRYGEKFRYAQIGTREIFLKLESGLPLGITSRVFAPGVEVTLTVNNKWWIKGHIKGIKEHRRPARLAKPVITVEIRCYNPFFRAVNGKISIEFENHGGSLYKNGSFTCSEIEVYNGGDIPCPVSVTMSSTTTSLVAPAGVLNYLERADNASLYSGILFKSGTEADKPYFFTTDTASDRFFESYSVHGDCDYFLLPPGKSRLFIQNVAGILEINPLYLYIDGRDL